MARIKTPIRSIHCSHIGCFDAQTFFMMMEQTPTWGCPICSKVLRTEDIAVDGYVLVSLVPHAREADSRPEATLTTSSRPAPPPSTPSRSSRTGLGVPQTTSTVPDNPSPSSPRAPAPPTSTRAKVAHRIKTSPSSSIQTTTTNVRLDARRSRSGPRRNRDRKSVV